MPSAPASLAALPQQRGACLDDTCRWICHIENSNSPAATLSPSVPLCSPAPAVRPACRVRAGQLRRDGAAVVGGTAAGPVCAAARRVPPQRQPAQQEGRGGGARRQWAVLLVRACVHLRHAAEAPGDAGEGAARASCPRRAGADRAAAPRVARAGAHAQHLRDSVRRLKCVQGALRCASLRVPPAQAGARGAPVRSLGWLSLPVVCFDTSRPARLSLQPRMHAPRRASARCA